ncbi:hypothetical protein QT238_13910 [Geobacillus stearothermophilus]|nr:hypothetical protein QT238_13910 [Geobacillus stearothermophilus]
MKSVFIDQWTENSPALAASLTERLFLKGMRELSLHFITYERLPQTPLWGEQLQIAYPDMDLSIQWHVMDRGLRLREKLQIVRSHLCQIVQHADYILLPLGGGEANLQQMITHEALQLFPDKVVFWVEEAGNENVVWMKQYAANRQLYHHVHELISAGNFKAVKKLLTKRVANPQVMQLLDLGLSLKTLDLSRKQAEQYFTILIEVLQHLDSELLEEEIAYIKRMMKLPAGDQKAFISFLYNYAELLYEQQELIDFIVIYYRLAEETLLYALGWDVRNDLNDSAFPFLVRKDAKYALPLTKQEKLTKHFHRYMKILSREVRHIEKKENVRIRRDKCVGLERLSPRDRYFADLYLFFNEKSFETFLDLRHEGVSGHGFADFTKEKFEALLGGQTPLQKIDAILTYLSLKPNYSIFQLVQKAVLGLIAHETLQGVNSNDT